MAYMFVKVGRIMRNMESLFTNFLSFHGVFESGQSQADNLMITAREKKTLLNLKVCRAAQLFIHR